MPRSALSPAGAESCTPPPLEKLLNFLQLKAAAPLLDLLHAMQNLPRLRLLKFIDGGPKEAHPREQRLSAVAIQQPGECLHSLEYPLILLSLSLSSL